MWAYEKRLQYPIDIKTKDLKMAKYLVTQYGGANGELSAALRYLNQRYTMPDNRGKAILTDIGTEELAHIEMISTMIYQLTKDATIEELKEAGLGTNYAEHNKALFPTDSNGVPFSVTYFAATGDPLADLSEDMAAEQKARAVYENLIDLTNDPDVIGPLLWLRQREIVHYNRFKELFEYYNEMLNKNKTCDCMWQGVCIYNEVKHNKNSPVVQRSEYLCDIESMKVVEDNTYLIRIKIPKELLKDLRSPGAYVLIKRKDKESDIFSAPISVMDVDLDKNILEVIVRPIGIKTKGIINFNQVYIKGPYFNGLFGVFADSLPDAWGSYF